jgi:hypothetical protein
MFVWCRDLTTFTQAQVQDYLNTMSQFESEYASRGVRFVYVTGNAENEDATQSMNRYLHNQQIREFCLQNGKILFDFEELDSWWLNSTTGQWEQSTTTVNGTVIPVLHPNFVGDYQWTHTTQGGCEQKARAFWWLVARLAGWNG